MLEGDLFLYEVIFVGFFSANPLVLALTNTIGMHVAIPDGLAMNITLAMVNGARLFSHLFMENKCAKITLFSLAVGGKQTCYGG